MIYDLLNNKPILLKSKAGRCTKLLNNYFQFIVFTHLSIYL